MTITGSEVTISTVLRDLVGNPHDAEGVLTLRIVSPTGKDTLVESAAITHDSTGHYHHNKIADESGLWHYRWLDEGQVADEGTFEVESEFDQGLAPDLTDLRVLVPRARRKCEGPWGNPNNRPPLSDTQVLAMVADACAEIVMLSGSFFHHELLVKARDPLVGFPTEWHTNTAMSEWESAVVVSQVALNYYYHLFRDMKISESIKNEGTEWTYSLSANVIRNYLESLVEERDRALAGLRLNNPVLDRFSSNIRVRDQATVAVLEWWAGQYDSLGPGGLPGGQEAAVVPVFFPPGIESP